MATTDYTALSALTPEFLGQDATDGDLASYRAAVRRVQDSPRYAHEEDAAEFVWNNGSIRFDAGVCAYCEAAVSDYETIPGRDDDESWEELAPEHENDCEWITTRAHRNAR